MSSEKDILVGNGIVDRISDADGEFLYKLARDVPVGQVIVSLSSGEDKSTEWLARGANEITGNNLHSVNLLDADCATMSLGYREKVGLLFYNASCEYEDVRKALLSWQGHLSPEARVVLCGYDQPGVARVIRECIGSYGNFVLVDSGGTIAVFAMDRCVHYWVIDYKEFGICKYCGRKRDFKRMRNESLRGNTKKKANVRNSNVD